MSLTDFFRRPDYHSEYTQFMADLKAKKPQLLQEQIAGRGLLWDKTQDREARVEYDEARVPQQPYVYQNHG